MADGSRVTGRSEREAEIARANWNRYEYGKQRGHVRYMNAAAKLDRFYLGAGAYDDGGQWDDDDRSDLEGEGRKPFEHNEIFDAINTALGNQIQNRVDITFRARAHGASDETAAVLSKVAMQIADNNDYRHRETEVCGDGFIQQRGYFDLRVAYDDNLIGEIKIETLDPMDVIPDPDAKSYDPDDWNDVIVTRWMSLDDIESNYGKRARRKVENSIGDGEGDADFGSSEIDGVRRSMFGGDNEIAPDYNLGAGAGRDMKDYAVTMVRIIDRQHWRVSNCEVALYPSGDIRIVDDLSEGKRQQALREGAMFFKRPMRRVRWTISSFGEVLLHDDWSPFKHFTVVPFFPFFRRGQTRGLIDNAIGPQEMLNKALSQYIHIINSTANSGWIVEENSLSNMSTDDLEAEGAVTGIVLEYKQGAKAPQKIEPNQVPTGVDRLVQMGSAKIRTVTGISDAMRGTAGPSQSGRAIQSLQFGSQLSLAVPLDNLSRTRHMLAKRMLALIQTYMDTPQVMLITKKGLDGRETTEELALNQQTGDEVVNNLTIGEYDMVVNEMPSQVTFENSQFEQMMAMMEKGAPIPWSFAIRMSNLADRGELARSMQAQEEAASNQTNPLDEAKAVLAQAQATAKNVEALFSAMRAAAILRSDPAIAGIADTLAKSSGFQDSDGGETIPGNVEARVSPAAPPAGTHLTPDNPQAGATAGILNGQQEA